MTSIKSLIKSTLPRSFWLGLSGLRFRHEVRARAFRELTDRVGRQAARHYYVDPFRACEPAPAAAGRVVRTIRFKGCPTPIHYRTESSDFDVMTEVFFERYYDCVAHETDVSLVVDCGANIGCASLFFLNAYPGCRVVAVEPDAGNFALSRRNLSRYGDRATVVQAGVWPFATGLKVERGLNRDGREWSFQVRAASPGEEPDVTATTIDHLLTSSGRDRIDILKVDIEGAEARLFGEGTERWLPRVRNLVIEFHGEECERAVARALAGYDYSKSNYENLSIFRNIKIKSPMRRDAV